MFGILLLVYVTSLAHTCDGYAQYRDRIPNGVRVPHPCKPNYVWKGVGHMSLHGGGSRNPFGRDFAENGHTWTEALCRMDSDGDGDTNGEELGDPNCTWKEGDVPENKLTVTHPGICDPHDSPVCQLRNWDFCDQSDEFDCDAINDPDVFNITLGFEKTKVPAVETSYYCMGYDISDQLEDNVDYHLIAMTPEIDNEYVMHHALLFGCEASQGNIEVPDSPSLCGMVSQSCFNLLGIWTLGLNGQCHDDEIGFLISKSRFPKLFIQFHWNNPLLNDNYWDSSALTIYLTRNKRPNNAGVLWLGNSDIEIPPRQKEVVIKGSYTSRCTNMFVKQPVHFVEMLNHMHYLGRAAHTDHIRNGTLLARIGDEPDFNYDNPVLHKFSPPVEFRAGDELTMYCQFTSADTSSYTYYGEGTSDEMCFGFLTYYPEEEITSPMGTSYGEMDICSFRPTVVTDGCEFNSFANFSSGIAAQLLAPILQKCRVTYCRPGCQEAVAEVRKHKCMQGKIGRVMRMVLAGASEGPYMNLLAKFRSCEPQETCSNPAQRFSAPSQINETCDVAHFLNMSSGALEQALTPLVMSYQACIPGTCRQGCRAVVEKIRDHPCFHDEAGEMMDLQIAIMSQGKYKTLFTMFHNCDAEMLCDHPDANTDAPVTPYAAVTSVTSVNAAIVPKLTFYALLCGMTAVVRAFLNLL